MKQAHAEPFFEGPDLVAQGGLADMQLQRGMGEVAMACRGLEGAQGVERKMGARHGEGVSFFDGRECTWPIFGLDGRSHQFG
jgi:hypothetical protein